MFNKLQGLQITAVLLCALMSRPIPSQEIGRLELTNQDSSRDAVKLMIAQHAYQDAGKELSRLLVTSPDDHELLVLQALNLFHEHKNLESRAIVTKLLGISAATAEVRVLSGLLFVVANDLGAAEKEFRIATEEDSRNAAAHYYLGRALYMRQAIMPSITEFERTISLDANFIQAYDALGLAYFVHEDVALAQACFLRGIEQEQALDGPKLDWLRLDLASMLLTHHRAPEAAAYLADAERINPLNTQVYLELGQMYFQERRYSDAISAYGQVLNLDPYSAVAHYFRGRAYHLLGDDRHAEEEFSCFVTLNRQHDMGGTAISSSAH